MRTLGVSRALTVLILVVVALSPFGVADARYYSRHGKAVAGCPPGWEFNPDNNNCLSPSGPAIRCDGRCQKCFYFRGAKPGETGGAAGGCPTCGPDFICGACAISLSCSDPEENRNIDPNLPGKPKSSEPVPQQDTQPKGGGIFKQMKP
jgi:hypothetical protein